MKSKTIFFLILLIISLAFYSCVENKKKVNASFYYWKQKFSLTETESEFLKKFDPEILYLKFFDIDLDLKSNEVLPVLKLDFNADDFNNFKIIPCIFITNRALEKFNENNIAQLSDKITSLLKSYLKKSGKNDIHEIQIDCDWNLTTKNIYFNLLKNLKKEFNDLIFSATIRLHQIKYYKTTGVPPVDKGVLMFYNMKEINDYETKNSIIDIDEGKKYIYSLEKYPLKLDVALPCFSWAVLFRFGKITGIINNTAKDQLSDEENFLRMDENHFKIKKNFYFNGFYLYKDDIIRYEFADVGELKSAGKLLSKKIKNKNLNVIFFHLNEQLIKEFSYEDIKSIADSFN
jgi:hypothetical protein